METFLKTGFAQIFSCCLKNLSCSKFERAVAPLSSPGLFVYAEKDRFLDQSPSLG